MTFSANQPISVRHLSQPYNKPHYTRTSGITVGKLVGKIFQTIGELHYILNFDPVKTNGSFYHSPKERLKFGKIAKIKLQNAAK